MPSHGKMYWTDLRKKRAYPKGWLPNWPLQATVRLGQVGELSYDRQSGVKTLYGQDSLARLGIKSRRPVAGNPFGPLQVSYGTQTDVKFGTDAKVEGWGWLGSAGAGVDATFGRKGGFELEAVEIQRRSYPDVDGLKQALREAVEAEKLRPGKTIVVEVETAKAALFIASEGAGAALKMKLAAGITPVGVSLATFSVGFDIEKKSGSVQVVKFPTPVALAFRAVTVGTKGIFFWREIPIRAATFSGDAMSLNIALAEEEFTDKDYLVRFEAAPSSAARTFTGVMSEPARDGT